LFGEFPHRTSAGIFIPTLGTVALHCPVARLVSESFLMLVESYRYRARGATNFVSILRGEQSGLLTHIATTESVSLCVRMKS
jgi:hypothetical protein